MAEEADGQDAGAADVSSAGVDPGGPSRTTAERGEPYGSVPGIEHSACHETSTPSDGFRPYAIALFIIVATVLGGLWLLLKSDAGSALMQALGKYISVGLRFSDHPFLDIQGPLLAAQCTRLGYDVLQNNPCYPLGLFNYSPLLLYVPLGPGETTAVGFTLDGMFVIAAVLVLRPRNRNELLYALACMFSLATLFAIERANIDVFIFVGIVVGIYIVTRTRHGRYLGYGCHILVAALKFYPVTLVGLLLREKPRARAICGSAWILAVVLFVVVFHTDLQKVLSFLPAIDISDQIGALILPLGAATLFGWNSAAVAACRWVLTAACITIAFFRWRRHEAVYASADWNCETSIFLVAGALVFVGAFFAYANIAYRAIFMLLTIPGLQRLAACIGPRDSMARLTLGALPLCLSQAVVAKALAAGIAASAATAPLNAAMRATAAMLFVLREIAWWWIVTTLTTTLIAYLAQSWRVGVDNERSGWSLAHNNGTTIKKEPVDLHF